MALTLLDPMSEAGWDFLWLCAVAIGAYIAARWYLDLRAARTWRQRMKEKERRI